MADTDWPETRSAWKRLRVAWINYVEMRREARFMKHFGNAIDALPKDCPRTARFLKTTLDVFAEETRARITALNV